MNNQFSTDPHSYASQPPDPSWQRTQTAAGPDLMTELPFNFGSFAIHVTGDALPFTGGRQSCRRLWMVSGTGIRSAHGREQMDMTRRHLVVQWTTIIKRVRQYQRGLRCMVNEFHCHHAFIGVQWHHAPERNSLVLRAPGMQSIPASKTSSHAAFTRIGVFAVQSHTQHSTIQHRQFGRPFCSGQSVVHFLQNLLNSIAFESFAELRVGRQSPRPKQRVVMRTIRRPAQRPVVPRCPNVHRNDKRIRIARPSTVVRHAPVHCDDCSINCAPYLAVHSEPPCSLTGPY